MITNEVNNICERAARMANNPATGGKVAIPAAKVPAFKPGNQFKNEINKREKNRLCRSLSAPVWSVLYL